MPDNNNQNSTEKRTATDGGVAGQPGQAHQNTDYLNAEVNLLKPSTLFMRDHLRVVWTGFAIWFVIVFGPVTLTRLAPGVMTSQIPVIGFPLHYLLVAIGAPTGALILSFWYARKRDALDRKYGIEQTATEETGHGGEPAVTDGGENE
ncbi:DUF4212 domain-containing protein [Natrinema gelatinilyticum]|uniref:DUF4212 domain-containing protein n=1 Tax=Natrinema gelatinilyticum TaxID=2961571 RepID=UPI0020C39942|nr:DUF4212 domain-containing protein [Natrinema gelatinilyticum]